MNVFVLNSGRVGSTTFTRACAHLTNYTAGHESRCHMLGAERLAYPDNHIEVDNRLSWMLGRLDVAYGDRAIYVHLRRKREEVAHSFAKRIHSGIVRMYGEGIITEYGMRPRARKRWVRRRARAVAEDMLDTVDANIEMFLRDKTRVMEIDIATAQDQFQAFVDLVGAEGDIPAAVATLGRNHNPGRWRRRKARRLGVPLGEV